MPEHEEGEQDGYPQQRQEERPPLVVSSPARDVYREVGQREETKTVIYI